MRSVACSIVLMIIAAGAVANDWSINIVPARKRIVKPDELRLFCQSENEREIEGCMEFLGETLRCECRRAGRLWSMTAHAQLIPYMYITRPSLEQHEQAHLDDLRAQLEEHLGHLAARRFQSRASCTSAADFEITVFGLRMDLFRKLSNERLH